MNSIHNQPLGTLQLRRAAIFARLTGASWPDSIPFDNLTIPVWTPAMIEAHDALYTGEYTSVPLEGERLIGAEFEKSGAWRWEVDREGDVYLLSLGADHKWKAMIPLTVKAYQALKQAEEIKE